MEDRASVTKRYPNCYHLRSLVLLSEPEMEAAVSPPASLDTHSPYLRLRAEAGTSMLCKEARCQSRHRYPNFVLHQEPATTIPHAPAHL